MPRATPLNQALVYFMSLPLVGGSRRPGSPRAGASRVELARISLLACIAALVASGCSGRTSYITGGPTTGQLKTSLSHLEYENDQLKTQVARLKEENRTMEDRLVQEQIHTGTLTAKLDDARNALQDRGLDDDEFPEHSRTLPAGRKSAKPRKAPTAQISFGDGYDDDPPPLTIEDDPPPRTSRPRSQSRRQSDDSVSLNLDDDVSWSPVSSGNSSKAPAKR